MKRKKSVLALALLLMALLVLQIAPLAGNVWVGIGYLAAKNGASAEAGAVIGVAGVAHAAIHGAAWGTAFGGPAGTVAGVVAGL